MYPPCSIPLASRGVVFVASLSLLALCSVLSATGCGAERVATAANETSRRPAHVRPAKLPPLQIRRLPSGDRVISLESDLYFSFNDATLTPVARSQLRTELLGRVLAFLAEPGARVVLRGYTDGAGDSAYNLRLSLQRARAARSFLVAGGAPATRLSARGFGEARATSAHPDRALRRVDIVLLEGGSR
jgi:outer membrane protein OmpA-like peptidoglycan-associated protein